MILYTCPICYRVNEGDYCPVCSARLRQAMNYDPLADGDDGHMGSKLLLDRLDWHERTQEWADTHGPEL